jgi:hemerythrin-like domain-containing protein
MHERPTDGLRREHELILVVVEAMEREAEAMEAGEVINRVRVAQMMDFARNFTEGCHHRKEEDVLFSALVERSSAAAAAVRTLLEDHRTGSAAVRAIDRSLPDVDVDERDRDLVVDNLELYAALLRRHIAKEDMVLFPLAELVLSDMEQEIIAEELRRIEEMESASGERERYHALARQLARSAPAGYEDPRLAA